MKAPGPRCYRQCLFSSWKKATLINQNELIRLVLKLLPVFCKGKMSGILSSNSIKSNRGTLNLSE